MILTAPAPPVPVAEPVGPPVAELTVSTVVGMATPAAVVTSISWEQQESGRESDSQEQ